jgi:hypothetical protein
MYTESSSLIYIGDLSFLALGLVSDNGGFVDLKNMDISSCSLDALRLFFP